MIQKSQYIDYFLLFVDISYDSKRTKFHNTIKGVWDKIKSIMLLPDSIGRGVRVFNQEGLNSFVGESVLKLAEISRNRVRSIVYSNRPYDAKIMAGIVERPFYGYCLYTSGMLAQKLGYDAVSVFEFGVGNGDGLENIGYHLESIEDELSVNYEIYGFDTGEGPPQPSSYKDMPYAYDPQFTEDA